MAKQELNLTEPTRWFLGTSDCDTCGSNWEEADFDPTWDEETGVWLFGYRVGCYSGDSLLSTDEDRETRLEEMFARLRSMFSDTWTKTEEKQVRALIAAAEGARP